MTTRAGHHHRPPPSPRLRKPGVDVPREADPTIPAWRPCPGGELAPPRALWSPGYRPAPRMLPLRMSGAGRPGPPVAAAPGGVATGPAVPCSTRRVGHGPGSRHRGGARPWPRHHGRGSRCASGRPVPGMPRPPRPTDQRDCPVPGPVRPQPPTPAERHRVVVRRTHTRGPACGTPGSGSWSGRAGRTRAARQARSKQRRARMRESAWWRSRSRSWMDRAMPV
jgi:hypothetical protein